MYLKRTFTYYKGTTAHVLRAPFLILLQLESDKALRPTLYAVVRKVALKQLGHWMMGSTRLGRKKPVTLSGSLGNDGLPVTVTDIPKDAIPLPSEIADVYWKDDGWNTVGATAADLLRSWAWDNIVKPNYITHS